MMNTFIIVNIIPTFKDPLEDKSMLFYSKRSAFSLQFGQEPNILGHSFEIRTYGNRQSRQRIVNNLLMVNINPLYIRDNLENKSILFTHFYLMKGKK